MSELETTTEAETEEFTDDLSDEALDRREGGKDFLIDLVPCFSCPCAPTGAMCGG